MGDLVSFRISRRKFMKAIVVITAGFKLWSAISPKVEAKMVVSDTKNDFFISWSPDSNKIIYNSENQIWVFDLKSRTTECVTENGVYLDGKFSPDGRKIAFVSIHNDSSSICVMEYRTGVTKCFEMDGKNLNPKWSPDGSKIAFVRVDKTGRHLWVMNADGSNQRPLTHDLGKVECWNYDWSPDGSRIAFSVKISGKREVWVMNEDGSGKRKLGNGMLPEWVSESKLVYKKSDCELVSTWLRTYKKNSLLSSTVNHYSINNHKIVVSDRHFNILVINKTNDVVNIGYGMLPVFSPDGKKIAFMTDKSGNIDIRLVYLDNEIRNQRVVEV